MPVCQTYSISSGAETDEVIALLALGDESIVGIVDLMTGEKDPRNLMLVFSILKVVMVEWDISNHAEVCLATTFSSSID